MAKRLTRTGRWQQLLVAVGLIAGLCVIGPLIESAGATGSWVWLHQLGTIGNDASSGITVVDSSGSSYIVGGTSGTLPGSSENNAGAADAFVAKYDAAGNRVWVHQLGSNADDSGQGAAVDASGNVFVTGWTWGTLAGSSEAGAGTRDAFIAKYDAAGNRLWVHQLGTTGDDLGLGIAIDTSGNSYVTGPTDGNLPGSSETNVGLSDVFVAKYGTAGNRVWVHEIGSTGTEQGAAVAVDTSGNPYVTGTTAGTLSGSAEMNAGGDDVFVTKYDTAGNRLWLHQLGSASAELGMQGAVVDTSGNVYLNGWTDGTLPGSSESNAGAADAFVAKYNSSGGRVWVHQLGTAVDEAASGVAVDTSGNLYVTGRTAGTLPGSTEANSGSDDVFVAMYNAAGNRVWVHQLGTPGVDSGSGVDVDSSGNLYMSGRTAGTLPGSSEPSAGANDAFTAKYDTSSTSAPWSIAQSPNQGTFDNVLNAVSCATATSCVAVGWHYDGSAIKTLIETWNGSTWSITPSANVDVESQLLGVSCTSPIACTAVGISSDGSRSNTFTKTLVETWNGTNWSVVASPNPGVQINFLNGVSCVSSISCVAVGYYNDGSSHPQTLVESWDGNEWSLAASPNPSAGSSLYGVSCLSATSCVAVGGTSGTTPGELNHTIVESWDGTTWSVTQSPSTDNRINSLQAVSCVSATSCMAVGDFASDTGPYQTLTESWNGTTWSIVPTPSVGNGSSDALFGGVSCVTNSSCIAVGQFLDVSTYQTLIEIWDGTAWSVAPSPNTGPGNLLDSVSCTSEGHCVAVGQQGSGTGWSGETTLVMASSTSFAPAPPTSVSALRGNTSASVTFTPPASDGGSAITSYATSCASSNGGTSGSANGASSPILVSGLTNGKTYTCTVTATNAVGTSSPSTASNAFVPATVPTAPRAPSAFPGNGRATVSWTAPGSNGGSAVTGYSVTPYLAGAAQPVRVFNSTATTEVVTGLTNTKSYTFKIAAKNAVGIGPQSVASAAILVGLPTAPTNVNASANTGRATVRWTAPAHNGGSAITGYVVTPYKAGVAQSAHVFASTATSQTISGLTNGATYTFKVAASNATGVGPQSAPMSPITVGPPTAPSAPTVTKVVPGNAQVTLTWSPPASNGSASITGYIVTPYLAGVAQSIRTFNANTTQVVTGLTNAKSYTFKVAAQSSAGTSPQSAASSPVIVGTPVAPTSVHAAAGNAQATVSWTAPASDSGSGITDYVVTPYKAGVAQPARNFHSTATTQNITGLTTGASYTFNVAAKNARGTGPKSAASNAVTPS